MADNRKIAENVLNAVGGEANVANVTHCMTRLRFNLKDQSMPKDEEVKKIAGVLGVVRAGGQYQVIIGQNVSEVYAQVCKLGKLQKPQAADGSLDKPKEKLTPKALGSAILNGLAGCLTPLIPVLVAASMFKMLVAVLGPGMLNVMAAESDIYTLFTLVGDAGFYFFPLMVGYTAAKKFGCTPVLGVFLGAIMMHPTFLGMAEEGASFTVFGIPCAVQNYSSTLLPIILSVWVMSYIEKFFNKKLPASLRTILAPTFTIFIMLPITLCVLGPVGGILGNYICTAFIQFGEVGGFLAVAVIAALYEILVMSGMHLVLLTSLIMVFSTTGQEALVSPAAAVASVAVSGMVLGAVLRIRDKEQKSLALSYLVASLVGGVTEPALYGLAIRYKRPFIGLLAGGFVGGLYAGITGVTAHAMVPVANFVVITSFAGGPVSDLVHGSIACVIGFVVAAIVTYLWGFDKKEPAIQK